jgi:hypothetical protein
MIRVTHTHTQGKLANNKGTVEGYDSSVVGPEFKSRRQPKVGKRNRVQARSITSTVVLRVVGGDEKGTQCLGV